MFRPQGGKGGVNYGLLLSKNDNSRFRRSKIRQQHHEALGDIPPNQTLYAALACGFDYGHPGSVPKLVEDMP